MKRLIIYILFLFALVLTSCDDYTPLPKGKSRCIVVLHSYDNSGEEGEPFTLYMEKAFRKEGIRADIHHVYMDATKMPHGRMDRDTWQAEIDSILKWKPEIILANGDYILNFICQPNNISIATIEKDLTKVTDSLFHSVPIVFAGVTTLRASRLKTFPNITGFEDRIDLQRNVLFYHKVTQKLNVTIELDHFFTDSIRRKILYDQIADSNKIINNGDFHVVSIDESYLREHHPKTPVVNFISVADPESNEMDLVIIPEKKDMYEHPEMPKGLSWKIPGVEVFKSIMSPNKPLGHLQVKYDIYSNTLIDHSGNPQFTAIRTQFNNPEYPRFIGGYFSSMETQIDDQVHYAAEILNGRNPKNMLIGEHAPDYYMDYNAMKKYAPEPLKYEDWCDKANIINVPFDVARPIALIVIIVLAVLIVLSSIVLGLYYLMVVSNRDEHTSLRIMKRENERRQLLMNARNISKWTLKDGTYYMAKPAAIALGTKAVIPINILETCIDKDSLPSFQILKNYGNGEGTQSLRLKVSFDAEHKNWKWFELRFTSTTNNLKNKTLSGIGLFINDVVEKEERLHSLLVSKSESDFKQNYLCNISHDIRTPLNAVTGFAQLLTAEGMEFSNEEKEEFTKTIHDNSEMMIGMIESVIDRTKFDIKELQVKPIPTSAREFIMSTFNTHFILTPSHLYLKVEKDEKDYTVMMDPNLTRQVINNFIGNAFKFTPQGGITIGYRYLHDTSQVLFYCKDTGIGLTEEDRQQVFGRFYKVNENANGTGLGLNISQTIIKEEGGEIGVNSKFGVGSTFWFKLNVLES